MKEIFLSFRPEFLKPILYGMKKYEYRKRFCDEETRAYLYLSGKSRQVIGVMELGRTIRLKETRDNYIAYPDTLKRVDEYVNQDKIMNAVPIKSLELFDQPITLEEIRTEIPNFRPPQMYFVLDNQPKLKDILKKQHLNKPIFIHKHDKIYYDNLALSVSEMEKTAEFKKLDSLHSNDFPNFKY